MLKSQRGYTLAELLATLVAAAMCGLLVAALYVLIHFITKYW